ncbi:SOH1-domain-containing protein [Aulographum hederae CBS 113979]|uniref:Mediator of RNA polymerase II transcription subunit 31 n=1 Tax=Aulographum hederae CBS 113979 TaxID=1176131 RepID=A0A6G1GWH7_9PEZI|nr:SOH1-domain-containing protein [Aulographum hederae CBS 113979]
MAENNNTTPPDVPTETYGGYSRFELELEFVQMLSNPAYLGHLAYNKYFDDPSFVAYLAYLQYWTRPEYVVFLDYPGPTLRVLELLQVEQFRKDIIMPAVAGTLDQAWRHAEPAREPQG